jgi:hypothetical protein
MTIVQSPGREIPLSVSDPMTLLSGTDVPPQDVTSTLAMADNAFEILEIFPGYAVSHTGVVTHSFWG